MSTQLIVVSITVGRTETLWRNTSIKAMLRVPYLSVEVTSTRLNCSEGSIVLAPRSNGTCGALFNTLGLLSIEYLQIGITEEHYVGTAFHG